MTSNLAHLSPGARNALRVIGGTMVLVGLVMTIVAFVSFLQYKPPELTPGGGLPEGPDHFWMGFVGLPLIGFGAMLLRIGFLSVGAEIIATETGDAVEHAVERAGRGWSKGLGATSQTIRVRCRACGFLESEDAKFCSNCKAAV